MKHLGASRQGVHACRMAAGLMRNISHVTADALTFDALRASYKILQFTPTTGPTERRQNRGPRDPVCLTECTGGIGGSVALGERVASSTTMQTAPYGTLGEGAD